MSTDAIQPSDRHHRIAGILFLLVSLMVGASYAAVPLYKIFCQVTGYGGTTQRADGNPKGSIARQMTVRFDSNIDGSLPWTVRPATPVTDRIGNVETVVFTAHNLSNKTVTGQASVQRFARPCRYLFQQDRVLLLHRADA